MTSDDARSGKSVGCLNNSTFAMAVVWEGAWKKSTIVSDKAFVFF